jgi:predicted NAD/FAD-dependent oxidoreductase
MTTDVVIVGAGISGLMAARHLTSVGRSVVVVDKGRGVGGRMATRRIGDAIIDHGAQFFTTKNDGFAEQCAQWQDAGVVQPWFAANLAPDGSVTPDRHTRFRGATGMTAIAKELAAGLDVRTAARVTGIRTDATGWQLRFETGETLEASGVISSAPAPQALELLAAGETRLHADDAAALARIAYDPCLAALVVCEGPTGVPEPGALRPASEPLDWIADNQRKGISPVPALTLHAAPEFSAAHWDDDEETIVATLLDAADALGVPQPTIVSAQVQRWKFSKPRVLHAEPYLFARELPPLAFVGDAFHTARVEGAALSGVAGAVALDAALR